MKKKYYGVILSFILLVSFAISLSFTADASSISSFLTDETTRWSIQYSNFRHMGTPNTTFRYENATIKAKYEEAVLGGLSYWPGYINCVESSSGNGVITEEFESGNAIARVSENNFDSTTGHTTTWEITVYTSLYDPLSSTGKKKVFAHEFGHLYGLGHVEQPTQIMNNGYTDTMNVTSYDRRGLSVMNHTHTHSGVYSFRYETNNIRTHKKRCTSLCYAYTTERCEYTTRQTAQYIYYYYDCTKCGNQNVESIMIG